MHQIIGYHRPASLPDALELLRDGTRLPIGGGTTVRHDGGAPPVEVVDLQALGLDTIAPEGERVRVGATVTLQELADDAGVPDVVRRAARAEQPSTLRTLATVGGTIGAADPESVLLAALLVHGATVRYAGGSEAGLGAVLADGVPTGELIVSVSVETGGPAAIAGTGRTPADVPIVAAVGRVAHGVTLVALTGVGPVPRICSRDEIDGLDPPGDFRGSPEYRRRLATVLSDRAVEELA